MVIDEDLIFEPLAFNQWEVKAEGQELAVVTERYVNQPTYVVLARAVEHFFHNRDEVVNFLVNLANGD